MKTIAVVGMGVIGLGWATYYLANGLKVNCFDLDAKQKDAVFDFVKSNLPVVCELSEIPLSNIDLNHLGFSTSLEETVSDADFIQENIPEKLEIKHQVIQEIEKYCSAKTIIMSSSSGLKISDIQSGALHPDRIVLGHPFNPSHLIPLVEVCGGQSTSPQTIETTMNFYKQIGKKPILLKHELEGHIANRLQVALWREAFYLINNNLASVEDIDTAISYGPGLRWAIMGPLTNLNASGGDGGIKHVLTHLGPMQRKWSATLGAYPETDDYIEKCATGIEAFLHEKDFKVMLENRDDLLIQILKMKKLLKFL